MESLNDFFRRLNRIMERDGRYEKDSYLFVMASLDRAVRGLKQKRHVTGQELLKGIQSEAREQFGPMARTVFESWGLTCSMDFGTIVFNMVKEGILSKTDTDCLEDFRDDAFYDHLFNPDLEYRLNPPPAGAARRSRSTTSKQA